MMKSSARAGKFEGYGFTGFLGRPLPHIYFCLYSLLSVVSEEFPLCRPEGDAAVVAGGGAFGRQLDLDMRMVAA
ncbi:hypothetical protein IB265_33965, partial [Ensifer sp. ENS10]|nr:hypothetical protein [Ensifer sp. ENS10]